MLRFEPISRQLTEGWQLCGVSYYHASWEILYHEEFIQWYVWYVYIVHIQLYIKHIFAEYVCVYIIYIFTSIFL